MTLYDKIREAVFREPRLGGAVTRTVGNVEVFNTYGEPGAANLLPSKEDGPVGLNAAKSASPEQFIDKEEDMARAGHQDGDRINSLTATVAAIQATVATDPQQSRDLANRARIANDAIRVHSGLVK